MVVRVSQTLMVGEMSCHLLAESKTKDFISFTPKSAAITITLVVTLGIPEQKVHISQDV